MKLKIIIIVVCLVLLWLVTPVQAENALPLPVTSGELQEEQLQPLKTYFLDISPGSTKRVIELNPPATKLIVYSQLGETAIRCGDRVHNYSCKPGKPLLINSEPATPIKQFWAENPHEQQMRLRIDVYQASVTESKDGASQRKLSDSS
ncbi:hypothetical protein [Lyngbya aestuarii]|uniref:hypothetical protein n=1 Tax=Lyngbya aestuarii TaxID=118322 RepID=UPI00403D981A